GHPVAERQGDRPEILCRRDLAVEGLDALGEVVALRLQDPPRPEGVVADEEAAGPDPRSRGPEGLRVARLVDVAEDHVEVSRDLLHRADRVPHLALDPIGDAGPPEVLTRLLGLVWVAVGPPDLAARTDRPR